MRPRMFLSALMVPLVAACGAGDGGKVQSASSASPPPRRSPSRLPPVRQPTAIKPPTAQIQSLPGVEGVIGATGPELLRLFGQARLDVWEGDARKLQFTGTACVLDVYLYPSAVGREPQATYVDARRASDGRDVDRASCIAALRRP